jgi:hypothetical protein
VSAPRLSAYDSRIERNSIFLNGTYESGWASPNIVRTSGVSILSNVRELTGHIVLRGSLQVIKSALYVFEFTSHI